MFLDFDGVLHDALGIEEKFSRMAVFEGWLRQHPGVDVCISSSWREVYRYEILHGLFSEDIRTRIVGCTPIYHRIAADLHPLQGEGKRALWPCAHREFEIRHWLRHSWMPDRPWIALDDDPSLFAPGLSNLLICSPTVGLTNLVLEELAARVTQVSLIAWDQDSQADDTALMSSGVRAPSARTRSA